jgi:hypothetical protein
LGVLPFVAGCSTAPVQRPTQTIAPDSTTASTLKDVKDSVVNLAQQNTAIISAIQKSAQDTDQFRTEVKGGIASMTQNQFRFESWLAETSGGWRLRMFGVVPYRAAGQAGPELVDGPGGVVHDSVPDARSAGAGADAKDSVLSGQWPVASDRKGGPTMLQLTVAFLLGALLSGVVLGILGALHQVLADHLLVKIGVIVAWTWAKILALVAAFKPKPAAPAKS